MIFQSDRYEILFSDRSLKLCQGFVVTWSFYLISRSVPSNVPDDVVFKGAECELGPYLAEFKSPIRSITMSLDASSPLVSCEPRYSLVLRLSVRLLLKRLLNPSRSELPELLLVSQFSEAFDRCERKDRNVGTGGLALFVMTCCIGSAHEWREVWFVLRHL